MHIEPGVVEGAKIFLSYATAVAGLGLTVKLARDSIRDNGGALALALRSLIASSRQRLAGAVNAELTRLYWAVGHRLHTEVLGGAARATYGDKLIDRLGEQLALGHLDNLEGYDPMLDICVDTHHLRGALAHPSLSRLEAVFASPEFQSAVAQMLATPAPA